MKNTSSDSMSLRDHLGVLSAQKGLILAIVGVSVAVAIGYSVLKEPVYDSSATLRFTNPAQDLAILGPGTVIQQPINPDAEAAAAARNVTRSEVIEQVQENVDTGYTDDELRSQVEATVQADSNLVGIDASSGDAELSAEIADEFAKQTQITVRSRVRQAFSDRAKLLSDSLDDSSDPTTEATTRTGIARFRTLSEVADPVEITRPADVPSSPTSPKPVRDTLLAAMLGLLIGIPAAFVRNSLDRRINDSHEAQHQLEIPLVGYVRSDAMGLSGVGRNGSGFVSEDDLEAFRILRRNVDFLAGERELSSLVVTSALPEEGKSTVAAWYAYVSAVSGRRTLLVECDLRRPVLAERFGVKSSPGLSNFLMGEAKPQDVLRAVHVEGIEAVDVLPVIPAGNNVFQPTEMLASNKFEGFVDQITRAYDLVIFDSAPILPVGDTLELLPLVDGLLFCVRLGQTTWEQAGAARQAIDHLPEKPTGLVITGVESGSDDDYYGYYSYAPQEKPAAKSG